MDKAWLCKQLRDELSRSVQTARSAAIDAARAAKHGASASEKRESARVNQEYSNLARAQSGRADRTRLALETLDRFDAPAFRPRQPIGLGALIEVEDEERAGRTLFLAPVGAGVTLSGPGGDGFLSVVTPTSPIGRAVMGKRLGDVVDVTVRGEPREWTITYLE
ncbi:MAG: hypothetical protein Tsb0020_39770 [Haliangiales bacterium]